MKKTLPGFLLVLMLGVSACAPQATAQPTTPPTAAPEAATLPPPTAEVMEPTAETMLPTDTAALETPDPALPTVPASSPRWQTYNNASFGLSFLYPPGWFGPEVYMADNTLRLEIGSDVVYPYGTSLEERTYFLSNSYYIVIQYTRQNTNTLGEETFQQLGALQDGEAAVDMRGKIIRVREFDLGRFHGYEYISTLSETAQTEPVYSRNVMLIDDQSNLLTVMGTPNNVQINPGADWRAAYQAVDEAHRDFFEAIVSSIKIE